MSLTEKHSFRLSFTKGLERRVMRILTDAASSLFAAEFDAYDERNRPEQGDGSYRIDFKFEEGGVPWDAQAFVEGRQGNLYIFMLATTEEAFQAGTYDEIINHAISNYSVPQD